MRDLWWHKLHYDVDGMIDGLRSYNRGTISNISALSGECTLPLPQPQFQFLLSLNKNSVVGAAASEHINCNHAITHHAKAPSKGKCA